MTTSTPTALSRAGMTIGEGVLNLDGEGPEPTLGAAGHGGGEDAPSHPQAGECVSGLVATDGARPGKGDGGPSTAHHPLLKRKGSRHRPFLLRVGEAEAA